MKIILEIPQEVYDRLESVITETINRVLDERIKDIQKRDIKYTRKETAAKLRVSLHTLDNYAKEGLLKPQKIGKRVLYDSHQIESFLNRSYSD